MKGLKKFILGLIVFGAIGYFAGNWYVDRTLNNALDNMNNADLSKIINQVTPSNEDKSTEVEGQKPSSSKSSKKPASTPETLTIDPKDKATAVKIIAPKLKLQDYNELTTMAKGGITEQEKKEALSLLQSRLSEEEYATVMGLVQKYEDQYKNQERD